MDAMIGKLIKGLEEAGLRENTTIILWSDHGYFLGEHGFWCKHSTFYEAVQIPLIISSPKFDSKEETNSFTELVDIYPTLCELTGITPPNYLQGKSLTPVLKNPEIILKDEIYTRYKQGEAVIDKNYAYTEFVEGNKFLGSMLYDMTNDKKQNIDISNLPESKELIKKYSIKLEEMRNYVNKNPFQNQSN
jgi:arylsulfatase A-like enzyme